MEKPLLLCGVQPTNRLTLGNYLGAIKPIIREQESHDCHVFVADWHSTTIPLSLQSSSHREVEERSRELVRMLVACGIDPERSRLFVQSEVKEHLELFYLLLTHSTLGELQRMTQYKHLSRQFVLPNGTEMALVGLLVYPVLMAADILIYDADYVSIGEDQTQHLELTVNLAERMNARYGEVFRIPKAFAPAGNKAGIKIRDLQDPEVKMSKSSRSYEGVIFLDDDEETVRSKIMRARTDSVGRVNLDRINQPGIANLIDIYAAVLEMSPEEAHGRLKDNSYRELKEVVAEVVVRELAQIRRRYGEIDAAGLEERIRRNGGMCRERARRKLEGIRSLV